MITKLPEWYRVASIATTSAETLQSRSVVIASIIESKEIKWLFNSVKLFLNKKYDEEFKIELIKLFTDSDPVFQQKDNELELRVLCGAIAHEYVINDEYEDSIALALSLMSATFDTKDIINHDIINDIKVYLNDKSIELREQNTDLELFEDNEEEDKVEVETIETLKAKIDNIYNVNQINEFLKKLVNKIATLDEESNIHWWIFRGFSNYKEKPIKDLDIEIAPIILGKDLSDLTKIFPGPLASEQFLMKLINDNFQERGLDLVVFKDVINKIERADKENFIEKFKKNNIDNLCPIMFACQEALKIDDDKAWVAYFEKYSGLKAKTKYSIIDIARQFYIENLLVKCL